MFNSEMRKLSLPLLAVLFGSALTGAEPLTAPPAPFAAKEIVAGTPEAGKLSAMKMTSGGTASEPQEQFGVTCGSNALKIRPGTALLWLFMNAAPRPVDFSYWGSTRAGWGHPFKGDNPEVTFDDAAKTILLTKKFHALSETETDGVFTITIKVLGDGLVNVRYSVKMPEGAKITDRGLFITFKPFDEFAGTKMLIDGGQFGFSEAGAPPGKRTIFSGDAETLKVSPDRPGSCYSIIFPKKTHMEIIESREEKDKGNIFKHNAHIRVLPDPDGSLEFNLDMRGTLADSLKTADTFAGVNFWRDDRLHIPDYSKSRNLAPNPSFESGLRYYTFLDLGGRLRDTPVFETDDSVARTGNRSLKMNAVKGDRGTGWIQTFAVPSVPGKKYTLSFYAKGDRKSGLSIEQFCVSGVWETFPKVPNFPVTDEWKRYSCAVEAPNNVLTFLIKPVYNGNDPSGKGCVWVDDLQLEEGGKAADYTEKPLHAELLTSNPDNFLSVKDKDISARLRVTAAPGVEGTADCALEDFFYKTCWRQKFDFKTDGKGVAVVSLPLDTALGTGLYVLRADFALKDGYKDSDYFRISRMDFLDNTHKNKNIFAVNPSVRHSRGMDVIKRYRDIGFGSINYLPWSAATQIEENKQLLTLIPQYKTDFTVEAVKAVSFAKHGFKDLRKIGELTPEIEKKIEDAAFEAAQTYPEINIWYLGSELEYLVHDGDYKKFAKLQLAAAKGVRRFDSGKKFYLGGSCNMEPRSGTMHVDKYLKTVRELDSSFKFDGVTIHPYRTMPEHPDLDDDAAYFFSVLDKHGYKDAPVLWEEGIYYTYYNIPAWGLDPHQGCTTDHYRAGCPSYHMGWGERIAAAYFARSWLVALKYQDRVKQFNGWCSWMSMDAYLTPFALQKIPNTLGHLLGNAVFKQDIRFAPEMRCYVFEDEKKRPVAALWSHMPNVDRGFGESPKAAFNFKGQSPEFIDLMENPRSAGMDKDGNCEIQVTPFPLFIRGGAGDWDKLCASVRNARSLNSDKASLQISAKPLSASGLEITFVNQVTRDFNGKILLSAGGKPVERDLSLKGRESVKITVPMSVPIPADKIADIRLPVEILETGVKPFKTDLSFTAFAVKKLSGQTPDWKNIPAIKITNRSIHKSTSSGTDNTLVTEAAGYPGDFEAEYQMAWSKDDLWLRVNVTDDVFYHDANKKDTGGRYYNDSLQIYIDSLCNARQKETKGFDGDDYNYDFYPNMVKGSTSEPDGAVTAFRRYCPEQQMIGGLFAVQPNTVEPDIKGSFKKTDKGYVYDLKIPGRLIAPVELRDGSVCGFCVYLNDHDGKCVKGALSTTSEPGTGGYQNPHLYPVMLLTE